MKNRILICVTVALCAVLAFAEIGDGVLERDSVPEPVVSAAEESALAIPDSPIPVWLGTSEPAVDADKRDSEESAPAIPDSPIPAWGGISEPAVDAAERDASESAPTIPESTIPAWGGISKPAVDADERDASESAPTIPESAIPAWDGISERPRDTPEPEPVVSADEYDAESISVSTPEPITRTWEETENREAANCQCPQPKEPARHRLGMRCGLGFSAFRGHKALGLQKYRQYGIEAIVLQPAFAASASLVYAFDLTALFSLTAELQYSYYSAHGEFSVKRSETDFGDLHMAGVSLHTAELPILARANLTAGSIGYYVELGPMLGYNLYSQMYKNSNLHKPYLNGFAFGLSVGGGVRINDYAMLGIRWNFGLFEYAENSKGYPWAAQLGVTKFFF